MDKKLIPKTECLKDTVERVVPYWQNTIVPEIKVCVRENSPLNFFIVIISIFNVA